MATGFPKGMPRAPSQKDTRTRRALAKLAGQDTSELIGNLGNPGIALLFEGDGGGDAFIFPGQPGRDGATGAVGPVGAAIYLAAEQGEQGDFTPGPKGDTGATGATGAAGTGNTSSNTAVGSEPGSPVAGDIDLYSAADVIAQYESGWKTRGPLYPFTKPPVATGGPSTTLFGWINQNSATVDETGGGIVLACPQNATDAWTFLVKTIPATPYHLYVYLDATAIAINYTAWGLILRDSATGNFILFGHYFNNASTPNGFILSVSHGDNTPKITVNDKDQVGQCMPFRWLRISDDGANRTFHVSRNGRSWVQFYTQAHGTPLTPNQIGFGAESRNASFAVNAELYSWQEA